MNGLEALESIKAIELSHVEHEQDEDIDGEWVYTDNEVYDGTVAEKYPEEIEVLEKELKDGAKHKKAIEIIKNKGIDLMEFGYHRKAYTYNAHVKSGYCKDLTDEEFDLLKEELE